MFQAFSSSVWNPNYDEAHSHFLARYKQFLNLFKDGTPDAFVAITSKEAFRDLYNPNRDRASFPNRRRVLQKHFPSFSPISAEESLADSLDDNFVGSDDFPEDYPNDNQDDEQNDFAKKNGNLHRRNHRTDVDSSIINRMLININTVSSVPINSVLLKINIIDNSNINKIKINNSNINNSNVNNSTINNISSIINSSTVNNSTVNSSSINNNRVNSVPVNSSTTSSSMSQVCLMKTAGVCYRRMMHYKDN